MKIGVLSNSEISIPLLQLLHNNHIQTFVFADVEDLYSFRPLAHFCTSSTIPIRESNHLPTELYSWINEVEPDILFILGYKHLIDVTQVPSQLFPFIFNIHFGALPAFRGPNPVFWQLRKGVERLAITIHTINHQFDKGPVVWVKEILREKHFTYGLVNQICSHILLEGVTYILQYIHQRREIPVLLTNNNNSCYYKRPEMKDVCINWKTMNAREIINLVQACNPWNKGAITSFNNRMVKIVDAEQDNIKVTHSPGIILACTPLQVACRDGEVINMTMFNIDGSFVPFRYAPQYGFAKGGGFQNFF